MNGRNYGEKNHDEQYEKQAAGCSGQNTQQPASHTVHHGFFLHSFFRSWLTSSFPKPGGLGCF